MLPILNRHNLWHKLKMFILSLQNLTQTFVFVHVQVVICLLLIIKMPEIFLWSRTHVVKGINNIFFVFISDKVSFHIMFRASELLLQLLIHLILVSQPASFILLIRVFLDDWVLLVHFALPRIVNDIFVQMFFVRFQMIFVLSFEAQRQFFVCLFYFLQ